MSLLTYILVITVTVHWANISIKSVSNSPEGVSEEADYIIGFQNPTAMPSGSIVKYIFPSEFSIPDNASFPCEAINGFNNAVTCRSVSNTIYAEGGFPSSLEREEFLRIQLNDIINPASTTCTQSVQIQSEENSGAAIDSCTTCDEVCATSGALGSAGTNISTASTVIGAENIWTFNVAPEHEIPENGKVYVFFPLWTGELDLNTNDDVVHYPADSIICRGVTGDVSTSAVPCTYDNSLFTNSNRSGQKLTISSLFTQATSQAFSFTIENVRNPPVPNEITGFQISTGDSGDGFIDETTHTISVQVETPSSIEIDRVRPDNNYVGAQTTYEIRFTTTNPVSTGYKVEIDFPSELNLDNLTTVEGVLNIYGGSIDFSRSSQKITLNDGYQEYFPPDTSGTTQVFINLWFINNYGNNAPIGDFTITLTTNGKTIDTGTGSSGWQLDPDVISKPSDGEWVTPTSQVVNDLTTYEFYFQTTNDIPSGGAISIEFPSEINPIARDETTPCAQVTLGLEPGAKCQVVISTVSTLIVLDGINATLAGGSLIKFKIDQVQNPGTTESTGNFLITTHPSSTLTYKIDQSTADDINLTAIPSPFDTIVITPTSTITGAVTTYTFSITTTNTIPTGGYVTVDFPDNVSIIDVADAQTNCTGIAGFGGSLSCAITSTSIRVNDGFTTGSFNGGELLEFSVTSVKNPPSTAKYQSFVVTSYTSTSSKIDENNTGIFVKPDTANDLRSVSVSTSNTVNGGQGDFTFTIINENAIPSGSDIEIEPPAQVTFSLSPQCNPVGNLVTSVTCSYSGGKVTAEVTFAGDADAPGGSTIEFTVLDTKNPPSTEPSETFTVNTYTSTGYKIDKLDTGIFVTTSTAATITDITIIGDTARIAEETAYIIRYTPINTHPEGTELEIDVPSGFTLGTVTCTSELTLDAAMTCTKIDKKIIVQGAFTATNSPVNPPSQIALRISGITNPSNTEPDLGPWSLQSKDGTYLIDKENTQMSSFTCQSPCATCQVTADNCTSCIEASTQPYFYDGVCNEACKDNELDTGSYTCVECTAPCKTCETTVTTCTTCEDANTAYPYLYNDTCNAECESTHWGDGTTCTPCANPCATCSSSTECQTCEKKNSAPNNGMDTYLLGTECLVDCGSGYHANTSTFQCEQCAAGCGECADSAADCSGCPADKKLYGTTCLDACPTDTTIENASGVCEDCESPCTKCSGQLSNCTECEGTKRLYGGDCLDNCPNDTIFLSDQCQDCTNNCATCVDQTSKCLTCDSGFVFSANTCITTCPADTTIEVFGICEPCDSSCTQCAGTITTCTACASDKFLHNSECKDACPDGTTIPGTGTCTDCDANCQTCAVDTTTCTSCYVGLKLHENVCKSGCPVGTSVENNGICLNCDSSCATCETSTSTCTSCNGDNYLYNAQCLVSCPSGITIADEDLKTCSNCDSNCVTCETTIFKCITCQAGWNLYLENCYENCPENFTALSGVCTENPAPTDCNEGCTTLMLGNLVCNAECNVAGCNNDNGDCVQGPLECTDTQYIDESTCKSCVSPCIRCNSALSCITCGTNTSTGAQKLLYVDQCFDNCPSGSIQNGIICEACDINCATCASTTTTCTSCPAGKVLYQNACENSCPTSTTVQINDECFDCNTNCKTCAASAADECTSCSDTTVLSGTICLSNCPDQFTLTTATGNVCQACDSSCASCTTSTSRCSSCTGTKYLYDNQCLDTCPADITVTAANECLPCDANCVTCQTTTDTCTTCDSDKFLYSGRCFTACPSGLVDNDGDGDCEEPVEAPDCATGCTQDLLDNNFCNQECNVGACNYDNTLCSGGGTCPTGEYRDGTNCTACVYPCNTCQAAATCDSCGTTAGGDQLYLQDGSCLSACDEGYFRNGIVCEKCNTTCQACLGDANTCISCALATDFLYNGTCLNDCPDGETVVLGQFCEPCSPNCQTCQTTLDKCLTCPDDRYLYQDSCWVTCPEGSVVTTESEVTKTCLPCSTNCETCLTTTTNCLTCKSGTGEATLMYGSTCVEECPEKITVQLGDACVACDAACLECSTSPTNCDLCSNANQVSQNGSCLDACIVGYEARLGKCEAMCADSCTQELLNNTDCDLVCNTTSCNADNQQCVNTALCPAGQYRDGDECKDCEYPCNLCSSLVTCTSCRVDSGTSAQLLLTTVGGCELTCPALTYKNGVICEDCDPSCLTCDGNTASDCTTCDGTQLYNGVCQSGCPVGTTVEVAGVCTPCNVNCQQCSGTPDTCTECKSGTVLNTITNACELVCPDGYTTTGTDASLCQQCSENCDNCLGEITTCTSCKDDKALHQGQCITECPSEYVRTDDSPDVCQACSSGCLDCVNRIDKCTSCRDNKVLTVTDTCAEPTSCPDGTTLTSTSNNVCVDCSTSCKTCLNTIGNCTSCYAGKFLDDATNQCQTCDINCLTCEGSGTTCTACSSGRLLQGDTCDECTSPCKSCATNLTTCTSCISDKILYNNACVDCDPTCGTCSTPAPDGCTSCNADRIYYNGECIICDPSCKACNGPLATNCIECEVGRVLVGNECIQCDISCLTCNGSASTNCLSCLDGKTLVNSTCVTCHGSCTSCDGPLETDCVTCPSDRVYNNTTGACDQCHVTCLTCVGNGEQQCKTCETGKSLISGGCIVCNNSCQTCTGPSETECAGCIDGRSLVGGECVLCHSTCETCYGALEDNCLTCPTQKSLIGDRCIECDTTCKQCTGGAANQCTQCYSGFVLINNECKPCDGTCETCSGQSDTECLTCITPAQIVGQVCVICFNTCLTCNGPAENECTSCTTDAALVNGECLKCHPTCETCSNNGEEDCTSCPDNKYLAFGICSSCLGDCKTCANDVPTQCQTCHAGLYLTSDSECLECDTTCLTCANAATECTACGSGRLINGAVCEACDSNCVECDGNVKNCTECADKQTLILDDATNLSQCFNCHSSCKKCDPNPNICTECETAAEVIINDHCETCSTDCLTCENFVDNCTSCNVGRIFVAGDGVTTNNTCLPCDSNCVACANTTSQCTACIEPGQTLIAGECLAICEANQVEIANVCYDCDATCASCSASTTNCTTCAVVTQILYKGSCYDDCPQGAYTSGSSCRDCDVSCLTCDEAASCTSCPPGKEIDSIGQCIAVCNSAQYLSSIGVCVNCDTNCRTCESSETNCTSCPDGQVINGNKQCETPCDDGFVRTDRSNGECVACDEPCVTCANETTECTSCEEYKFLYLGQCLNACPSLSTVPSGNVCLACDPSCVTCVGAPSYCNSCNANQVWYQGQCLVECPADYEADAGKCIRIVVAQPFVPETDVVVSRLSTSDDDDDDTFEKGPVPFPMSGISVVTGGVVGLSALAAPVSVLGASVACYGGYGFISWTAVGGYLPTAADNEDDDDDDDDDDSTSGSVTQRGTGRRRRLFEISPSDGGDMVVSIAMIIIIAGLSLHVICNLAFLAVYIWLIKERDEIFMLWRTQHKYASVFVPILGTVFSFHLYRMLYVNFFNLAGSRAIFLKKEVIYTPMIRFSYFHILCVCFPLIAAQILILNHFPISNLIWMLALDSLFVTVLICLLVFLDIRKMEKTLNEEQIESKLALVPSKSEDIKELINLFPTVDIRKINPKTSPSKSAISARMHSEQSSSDENERAARLSLPTDGFKEPQNEPDSELVEPTTAKDPLDVSLLNETIDEPPAKEMNFNVSEEKFNTMRPLVMKFVPLDMQAADEEYTEVVAFTEENSDMSAEEEESPVVEKKPPAEEVLVEHNIQESKTPPVIERQTPEVYEKAVTPQPEVVKSQNQEAPPQPFAQSVVSPEPAQTVMPTPEPKIAPAPVEEEKAKTPTPKQVTPEPTKTPTPKQVTPEPVKTPTPKQVTPEPTKTPTPKQVTPEPKAPTPPPVHEEQLDLDVSPFAVEKPMQGTSAAPPVVEAPKTPTPPPVIEAPRAPTPPRAKPETPPPAVDKPMPPVQPNIMMERGSSPPPDLTRQPTPPPPPREATPEPVQQTLTKQMTPPPVVERPTLPSPMGIHKDLTPKHLTPEQTRKTPTPPPREQTPTPPPREKTPPPKEPTPQPREKTPTPPPPAREKTPTPQPVAREKTPTPAPPAREKTPTPPPPAREKTPTPPPKQKTPTPPPTGFVMESAEGNMNAPGRLKVGAGAPGMQEEENFYVQESGSDYDEEIEKITHSIGQPEDYEELMDTIGPPTGQIENQNELDFNRAIPDPEDPEVITVPHLQSGERLRLRKTFAGARIVDLENKVVEQLPPIDESHFDIQKTIIDEVDVGLATLISHQGEKVKVRRHFSGARIVDLEAKIHNQNEHLVGQTIHSEEDFRFDNALPDPEDPEVVVVTHKETGEDVRVRKSFHGAYVIDKAGVKASREEPIDINDYDLSNAEIDKEDVRIALIPKKQTKERVRVKRGFRNAKIVDLENKNAFEPRSYYKRESPSIPDRITSGTYRPEEKKSKRKRGRKKIPKYDIEEMFPDEEVNIDPANKRLANLANIIELYENQSKGWNSDAEEEEEEAQYSANRTKSVGRKFLKKPAYANTDLERVYGALPSDMGDEGSDDSDVSIGSINSRPKKKAGKKKGRGIPAGPLDNSRVRDLEGIYLQRLDVRPKPPTRGRPAAPERDRFFESPDVEYRPPTQDSANRASLHEDPRSHLARTGDAIVYNRDIGSAGSFNNDSRRNF